MFIRTHQVSRKDEPPISSIKPVNMVVIHLLL